MHDVLQVGGLYAHAKFKVINIHDKTIETTRVSPSKNCFCNDIHASITGFLNERRAKQNTCVTYIVGGKTVSFVPGENKSIIMMDSHPHDDYGALTAKFPNAEFQVQALQNRGRT